MVSIELLLLITGAVVGCVLVFGMGLGALLAVRSQRERGRGLEPGGLSGEPVVVAEGLDPLEAHLLAQRLEHDGVRAAVLDDQIVGMDWLLTIAVGGAKVVVPSPQAAEASMLIAHYAGARGTGALPEASGWDGSAPGGRHHESSLP